MTVYAPRVSVHPDRYGATKSGSNRLFVLHTSEGAEGLTSAENLAAYMTRPGDRTTDSGRVYGSSYQYVLDTDRVIPCVPEGVVSYSASGANHDGIHICFPGKAGQTREQWLDTISRAMIHQCAELLVERSGPTGIPLVRRSVADVLATMRGVCDHHVISLAYRRSTHTDVGPNFPWDVLAADVNALQSPPPLPIVPVYDIRTYKEDFTMTPILVRFQGYKNVFLYAYNTFTHLTQVSAKKYLRSAENPNGLALEVWDAHPQGMKGAFISAGLTLQDAVSETA